MHVVQQLTWLNYKHFSLLYFVATAAMEENRCSICNEQLPTFKPFAHDLKTMDWMLKSNFVVHMPELPGDCKAHACQKFIVFSLVESLLRSLMHAGFMRHLDHQEIRFRQEYLYTLLSENGCYAFNEELMFQNILEQLYFWAPTYEKDSSWIQHSSFMETKSLTIYTYYAFDGPYDTTSYLGAEDRLAYPRHPCNVMLYCSSDYDNFDWHFEQCYGWIT